MNQGDDESLGRGKAPNYFARLQSAGEPVAAGNQHPDPQKMPMPKSSWAAEATSTKFDDASWHYGRDFPEDLPDEAGGTHSGMFLAWALTSGLGGDFHVVEFPDGFEQLQSRQITPGAFFMTDCDGKLTVDDLNAEGSAFAVDYYTIGSGQFLLDYVETVGDDLPDLYHVADSWETFERLKPVFDQRFQEWKAKRKN